MHYLKRLYIIRYILTILFGVGLGLLFLFLRPYASDIFEILVIAMGLLTAVLNLPGVFLSLRHIKAPGAPITLGMSLGAVVLGCLLMFLQKSFLLILLAVYSIVFPLLRVLLVKNRKKQIVKELPVVISGLVMLLIFLTESENLVMLALSIFLFVLTAIYLVYGIFVIRYRFALPKETIGVIEGEYREK